MCLPARVLKRNLRTCKYEVKFTYPAKSSNTLRKWISVNDITSTTMNKEHEKKKLARQSSKKKHRKKYFIPFSNEGKKFTDMQSKIHFLISVDLPKDGNCQFSAVCHELMKMGIFRSAETLRKEIVLFLESNPNSADGTPLEFFSRVPWTQYLQSMARNGTYGDHITLQAITNLFNVQLVIYSTLGTLATQTITPVNGCPIATFYLGHFAEGAGEHYVCLVDDRQETSAANELNVSHSLMDEAEVPHGNRETEKEDDDDEDASDKNCETQAHDKVDEAESVPYLNPDVLEKVIKATLKTSPQMRQTLRAVSRFFQRLVDSVPLPQIYIPRQLAEDYKNERKEQWCSNCIKATY